MRGRRRHAAQASVAELKAKIAHNRQRHAQLIAQASAAHRTVADTGFYAEAVQVM